MPPTVTLAVLADRITNLSADICIAITKIEDLAKVLGGVRLEYERRHGEVVTELNTQKADLAFTKTELSSLKEIVTAQAKEISDLRDSVKNLQLSVSRALAWASRLFWALFVPFILGIVSFIIGVLTHTVVITFPK